MTKKQERFQNAPASYILKIFSDKRFRRKQLCLLQSGDDDGDENQLHDDAGNGRGDSAGDESGEGERTGVSCNAGKGKAHNAPDNAAGEHGNEQAGIDGDKIFLFEYAVIQQTADKAVGQHFKGHGNARRINGRHTEHQEAQQGRNKPYRCRNGCAADEARQQHGQMHGAEHTADFRDLAG